MKALCKKLYFSTLKMIESMVSLLSCVLFSKLEGCKLRNYHKQNKTEKDCYILGNGPALTEALKSMPDKEKTAFFVVNLFANQDVFWDLKPDNYILVDSFFWKNNPSGIIDEEEVVKLHNAVNTCFDAFNRVDWNMNLFIPCDCPRSIFKNISPYVNIIRFNRTPVNGWRWYRHWFYRMCLGMPKPLNIINAAVYCAIALHYKKIYLYGVNHSWMSDIKVDENNRIYTEDSHFYKSTLKRRYWEKGRLEWSLRSMAEAFASHALLEEYSQTVGVKIYNRTKGSFIDAYEFDDGTGIKDN